MKDFDTRCQRLGRFVQWCYENGLEKDKTRSWEILCVAITIIQIKESWESGIGLRTRNTMSRSEHPIKYSRWRLEISNKAGWEFKECLQHSFWPIRWMVMTIYQWKNEWKIMDSDFTFFVWDFLWYPSGKIQ